MAVGVYSLTPGTAPNPGHLITDVAPPAGCADGQFLQFSGGTWVCANGGGTSSQWITTSGGIWHQGPGTVGVNTLPDPNFDLSAPRITTGTLSAQYITLNGVQLQTSTQSSGGIQTSYVAARPDYYSTPIYWGNDGSSFMPYSWTDLGNIINVSTNIQNSVIPISNHYITLDPNRAVLGIAINGSVDDNGYCEVGVPGYFAAVNAHGMEYPIPNLDSSLAIPVVPQPYCKSGAGTLDNNVWMFEQISDTYDNGANSQCPNGNTHAYNKAMGLTYIPPGQNLTVAGYLYNQGGPGSLICDVKVLYSTPPVVEPGLINPLYDYVHGSADCTNAGGTLVSDTGYGTNNQVCRFLGGYGVLCPSGWNTYSASWGYDLNNNYCY